MSEKPSVQTIGTNPKASHTVMAMRAYLIGTLPLLEVEAKLRPERKTAHLVEAGRALLASLGADTEQGSASE